MSNFKTDLIQIYHNERGILLLMLFNFIIATVVLVFTVLHLNPNAPVIKVGYGDIGGYRDGTWVGLLAFPLLLIVFGIFHALIALRIFHKRGAGMTKFFLIVTTFLILGSLLVLIRLLGEE